MNPNELRFAFADIYPNWPGPDTSTIVTPEADDQDALNEDIVVAEESSATESRGRNIFIAMGVMLGLIIFFGGK